MGTPLPVPTSVLMCPPRHFEVSYTINPWMDPSRPVSVDVALSQWEQLRRTYLGLGVQVHTIEPLPGLPDMVYAANGALVLDGHAYGARFLHPERIPEGPAYLDHLADLGFIPHVPRHVNEGEGDFLLVGDTLLGGHGFRTSPEAHAEVSTLFDREVVSLRLVDPHFYHLDTALTPLGDSLAWLPEAFDDESRAKVRRRWPDALEVDRADADALGLNAFAHGEHLVVPSGAPRLPAQLAERGHRVVEVDVSELLRGGGAVKCCTLRLRR